MRRSVVLLAGMGAVSAAIAVAALVTRGRAAQGSRLERLVRTTIGLPSGPLGRMTARWMEVDHRPIYPVMARELDLRPEDDLLDVGCGAAGLLAGEAGHVRHVAGLDASEIQVDLARRRLAERLEAGTAEIVLGDAGRLPWEDGRFSVVTAYGCIEFVPDPLRALSEMHRVLRPGGRAVLTLGLATDDASLSGTKNRWGFPAWSVADGRRLLEEAGFGDVSISPPPSRYFTLQLARGIKPPSLPVPGQGEALQTSLASRTWAGRRHRPEPDG